MSVQRVQKNQAAQLVVRMFDSGDAPVTGVIVAALTVKYKKHLDTVWTTKTVLPVEWIEGPDGRYTLLFSSTELDTEGRFTFRVAAAGANTFTGDVDVVDADATVEELLERLLNGLATKVSTEAVKTTKRMQDMVIRELNERCALSEEELQRMRTQLGVLIRKV